MKKFTKTKMIEVVGEYPYCVQLLGAFNGVVSEKYFAFLEDAKIEMKNYRY